MVTSEEISERLKAKREGKSPKKEETFEKEIKKKKCPECGTENKENAKFCVGCGKNFMEKGVEIKSEDVKEKQNKKTCPQCKSEIPENAKFCVVCGETQPESKEETSSSTEENKSVPIEVDETEKIDPPAEENSIGVVIQELVLDGEGIKLSERCTIEGLNGENNSLNYEKIENIELKNEEGMETIEITTLEGTIKINGVDQDNGSEFVAYAREMVEKTKPQIDVESMDKIQKAKELLDAGAIDEEEFENIKRKILEKK
ncbi:MAG: double zinc ribbon domain-containing protein [Methanobacterium sp.]